MTNHERFGRLRQQLPAIQSALAERSLDGWLLYDLRARNSVAGGLLGLGEMSRRWFVLVPAQGEPHAITHGIEQIPWRAWPWGKTVYSAWNVLDEAMKTVLSGRRRIAMEFSQRDAVPIVDLVPAGVFELVRAHGVEIVSSGDLITRFYSRWTAAQREGHGRAAETLAGVANQAFRDLADAITSGDSPREDDVRQRVLAALAAGGCGVGADCMAARGVNAADPHYETVDGGDAFRRGDVVLLDLWAKESEDGVYADQTWMACLGPVPARAASLFSVVCEARDAAIEFLEKTLRADRIVQGYEADDVARGVMRRHGHEAHFIHRTGHSIDGATHGMGPNIDNFETHETRALIQGVGFSIEPGIYIPGEIGMRSEVNVWIGPDGPEVTPDLRQHAMTELLE
ncbi:MAG: M24 family metallopeptidase [Gemmatimonadetes bacterium]|nr:M24 family metallopeptidase [Gemmatimonadota bacterium]